MTVAGRFADGFDARALDAATAAFRTAIGAAIGACASVWRLLEQRQRTETNCQSELPSELPLPEAVLIQRRPEVLPRHRILHVRDCTSSPPLPRPASTVGNRRRLAMPPKIVAFLGRRSGTFSVDVQHAPPADWAFAVAPAATIFAARASRVARVMAADQHFRAHSL